MTDREQRLVRYDNELKIEAHQFNGIMQKFPNHFHEYYVIGFVEGGGRHLSCKNKDYTIGAGDLLLFNPLDNHTCQQIDDKPLDWRSININENIMRETAVQIGRRHRSHGYRLTDRFFRSKPFHKIFQETNRTYSKTIWRYI